jgi:hypothetical protein
MSSSRNAPPALGVLTDLYVDEADKDLIRSAYYKLAEGDPETFAVQFGVLLTAHAQAMRSIPARAEVKELVEAVTAAGEGISRLESRLKALDEATLTFANVQKHQLWQLIGAAALTGALLLAASEWLIEWLRAGMH